MSHKTEKHYLVKSVKELDDLVTGEQIFESDTNISNITSISNTKIQPKEITINSAIENYIEAERHMRDTNHEKAYLCLIRFLKEIQRIVDNGVLSGDHYQRYRDIYDHYMSDEVKSLTFQKLALLRDNLHLEYMTMTEITSDDREKCVSLPNDISLVAIEPFEQQSKKSFDIFNVSNVLKNQNYLFRSHRYRNIINERIQNHKTILRKCISIPNGLDMKCNEDQSSATFEDMKTPINDNKNHKHCEEGSVLNRVKSMTTGYSHIIAPLIAKQTLLKIEEYKEKVELKSKSNTLIEYEWHKNQQIYMFRHLNL